MQKGRRWFVNMNTHTLNSLVNSIQANINMSTGITDISEALICTCKKDNQITNSVRIILYAVNEYLETSLKYIQNTIENNDDLDIDEFTLPISVAMELSETLLLLVRNFNNGSHILSSKMKTFRAFTTNVTHLYKVQVGILVDELTDPSGPEGKVC